MIDGIDQLVSLYGGQDDFIKAFIESTLFLPPEIVQARNAEIVNLYQSGGKLPIRYSPSHHEVLGVKNKAEAITLTRHNKSHLPKYPAFNIKIDNDGNHENRRQIKLRLNQTIGIGKNSSIKNYIISHVWGLASHPLFFSSLWNIVLIPAHFNYLMDKDPESHEVVGFVKDAIQSICISLYQPYENLILHVSEIEEFKSFFKADSGSPKYKEYIIHFLTQDGVERRQDELLITENERRLLKELLGSVGKKFFLDYYSAYANGENLTELIPLGTYTYNSIQSRISKLKRIFKEDLNVKALTYILENEKSSRLDEISLDLAKELLEIGG
jgi:hypothetical protein